MAANEGESTPPETQRLPQEPLGQGVHPNQLKGLPGVPPGSTNEQSSSPKKRVPTIREFRKQLEALAESAKPSRRELTETELLAEAKRFGVVDNAPLESEAVQ